MQNKIFSKGVERSETPSAFPFERSEKGTPEFYGAVCLKKYTIGLKTSRLISTLRFGALLMQGFRGGTWYRLCPYSKSLLLRTRTLLLP